MPQNLELKARISSISDAIHTARSLRMRFKGILRQRDIYYCVPHGRLKLRVINTHKAEMIYYDRSNKKGRRYSNYYILPIYNPKLANELYTAALSQKVVVDKRRLLFLYKNARIHIDNVHGLGAFIEFEVLVKYGKSQAQLLMKLLSEHFKIKRLATIAASYSDLLLYAGKNVKRKQQK
jgi:adenylate cyclase class IV